MNIINQGVSTMASSVDPSLLGHSSEHIDMEYSENEDEVDQLDSDSDMGDTPNPDASSLSLQKSEAEQGGERLPGHSLLPATRLENIIQADGVTGHLSMSKEALFVVSLATEEFIKRMLQAGHQQASIDRRNVVNYRDMASTVGQYQEFMFLQDTIPSPLSLCDALQRREAKEKEMMEEDPAMSTWTASGSFTGNHPKGKGKGRIVNGKERADGSMGSIKRERRPRDVNGRWSYTNGDPGENMGVVDGIEATSWSPCSWSANEQLHFRPAPPPLPAQKNGIASVSAGYPSEGEYETLHPPHVHTSAQSRNEQSEFSSSLPYQQTAFPSQDETWPGQYTGPASGFLRPPGPFGRIPPNPGRTIYSQQHSPEPPPLR